LISYNDILQRQFLQQASLTVFLADYETNRTIGLFHGGNRWGINAVVGFPHCLGLDSELKANAIIRLNAERYDIRLS